ncbi:iron-containing alcohol dehydrogenase [Leucobacter sp. HY1910]
MNVSHTLIDELGNDRISAAARRSALSPQNSTSAATTGVLRLPQAINFGYGTRSAIAPTVQMYGQRAFIIVDPFLATTKHFHEVERELRDRGIAVMLSTEIEPELPVETLHAVASIATGFRPDVIIGWGGGSALDAAKLVALLVAHGGDLSHYYGENAVPGPVLPLIAVPTTAGTGSEVTPVAVISDTTRELKVGVSSPHLIPQVAIVDPELTLGAPASVTAYSGIDALVHAIESYTAADLEPSFAVQLPVFIGRNSLTETISLQAVQLIGGALESAVAHPDDRGARAAMSRGSLLAGMAFGSTGTHLSHAIQYPIGALTHTPHGLGTGLMLPYVLEACAPAIGERLAAVGTALGVGADPARAIDRIAEIVKNIGIPSSLQEIGVARSDVPGIAELTLASQRLTNIAPIAVDLALVTRIIEAAQAGDRARLRH